jgi:hypothetical protein
MLPRALRRSLSALAFAVAAALAVGVAGCSATPDAEIAESGGDAIVSSNEPAIDVDATYRMVFSHVPTLGSETPDLPLLTVDVTVDDQVFRQMHPAFDSLERAFIIIPRRTDGQIWLDRIEMPFDHRSLVGTTALRWVDVHSLKDVHLSMDDLSLVRSQGIAVGLDTNLGTVWPRNGSLKFVPTPAPTL